MDLSHAQTLASWTSMVHIYGGISEARAREMTLALEPLIAVDRKLSEMLALTKVSTPDQEAARASITERVRELVNHYLDRLPCTVIRQTRDAPLSLIFESDWTRTPNLVPVAPGVMAGLHGPFWAPYVDSDVMATEPALAGVVAAGYSVIATTKDSPVRIYTVKDPKGKAFSVRYDNREAAWASAGNEYLRGLPPVDHGSRIDMNVALDQHRVVRLAGGEGLFVVNCFDHHQGMFIYSGWFVEPSGEKGPRCAEGLPVKISSDSMCLPDGDDVDAIREMANPSLSGKGSLSAMVMNESGAVVREVSVKARIDRQTGRIRLVGDPMLIQSAAVAPPSDDIMSLAFDPFSEPDPLTGERYTSFCFVDDGGALVSVDADRKISLTIDDTASVEKAPSEATAP